MSVFVFNKDFAGIRTSGQEVNCRIDGSNVIVENIAKIEMNTLLEYGFFRETNPRVLGVNINGTFVYDREMNVGNIVQHYKGGLYEIVAIGAHTETLEPMVVYKSLSDKRVWIRPYLMFASPIDRYEHPEAMHPYRFVKVELCA